MCVVAAAFAFAISTVSANRGMLIMMFRQIASSCRRAMASRVGPLAESGTHNAVVAGLRRAGSAAESAGHLVHGFDAAVPAHAALTPPALWYTDAQIASDERASVFARNWVAVGGAHELGTAPGSYFTGTALGRPFVVVRLEDGAVVAYDNVCRHRGARIVVGTGVLPARRFSCPYHGAA